MRRFIAVAVLAVCALVAVRLTRVARVDTAPAGSASAPVAPAPAAPAAPAAPEPTTHSDNSSIARAFADHARNVRVDGDGIVSRILPDDTQGERHQRFLLRFPSRQSILIVHNIDIAPRVENLKIGDEVEFEGEYVWNDKGGLVHWTHHDPTGRHRAGWIRHAGRTYQ